LRRWREQRGEKAVRIMLAHQRGERCVHPGEVVRTGGTSKREAGRYRGGRRCRAASLAPWGWRCILRRVGTDGEPERVLPHD
jgi:hypothetical protein